jgi:hypothetical protein
MCQFARIAAALAVAATTAAEPPAAVALRLIPAAEPVPALRYRLLPELRDTATGNAVTAYYRAFSPEWQTYRQDKGWGEKIGAAMDAPLDSPTLREFAWVRHWHLLKEVDRGARRSYCDWQLTDRLREDGIMLLIPDVSGLRQFAAPLAVRARLEMADGKFSDAARSLQTGFALARHVGDGPTLIQGLVAIAIAQTMCQQVETWVQTPGAPNLYWALSDLPVPLVDLRAPMQGERIWVDNLLPGLRDILADPSRPPLPAETLRKAVQTLAQAGDQSQSGLGLSALTLGVTRYPAAKRFLAERGWSSAQIEAMPVLQAVFLQELFEYERIYDDLAKAVNLPYPQAITFLKSADDQLLKARQSGLSAPVMAQVLSPAIGRVFAGQARLDRKIAALRIVEAIRMHAAANGGALPDSLDSIQLVPVPADPGTGRPFGYTLANGVATLTAPMLPGTPRLPANALRFELSIAK